MPSKRQKGQSFEREVCVQLSLWITHGKDGDLFWRSAMSGGRATVRNKDGIRVRQSGDMVSVTPEGHKLLDRYYFEMKFYKDLMWPQFLFSNYGYLARFWEDTRAKAVLHSRTPVMIVKQNYLETLLIVPRPMLWPFDKCTASLVAQPPGIDPIAIINYERMLKRVKP